MLHRIECAMMTRIRKYVDMDDARAETCMYGLDLLLYTIISTAGLLLIGIAFGAVIPTCIIIFLFYLNQSIGGGFHANSHTKCFFTMTIGLSLLLIFVRLNIPQFVYPIVGFLSCIGLFCCPLVLHRNKAYLASRTQQLKFISRLATCIQGAGMIGGTVWGFQGFIRCIAAGVLGAALSRSSAVVLKRLNREDT